MKFKLLLGLVLGALITGRAYCEVATTVTVNGLTNYYAETSTNTSDSVPFDVRKFSSVAFYPKFKLTGSGTGTIRFLVEFSGDAESYSTTSNHTFYVTANGTTDVVGYNVISLGNYSYLKISEIANTNGVAVTNFSVKAVLK